MSGGGFMSGGMEQSSPTRGGAARKGPATLRPVTIRQLLDAYSPHPDAEFSVDDSELGQLTFVAQVISSTPGTANYSFTLHDGTGTIDARHWSNQNVAGDDNPLDKIKQHSKVRVVGTMKSFNNKRHVVAGHIRELDDPMEEFYHILDTIYVHQYFTQGLPGKSNGGATAYDTSMDYAPRASATITGLDTKGMNHLQRKIATYFNGIKMPPEDGVDVQDIAKACTPATLDQVRDEVQNLVSDGHLYTTYDDDHILSTAMME